MKKYNVKAAVYIIASRIDKAGYLNSEQIKELDSSGLVEIGNHATAIHFCGYTREVLLSDRRILNEYVEDVKECSRRIYTILGHGTESIAYPGGVYTPQLDQIIRVNLGYTTTFTTDHGLVKTNYDVVGPMKRIYRVHGDTPEKIEKMIQELKQC